MGDKKKGPRWGSLLKAGSASSSGSLMDIDPPVGIASGHGQPKPEQLSEEQKSQQAALSPPTTGSGSGLFKCLKRRSPSPSVSRWKAPQEDPGSINSSVLSTARSPNVNHTCATLQFVSKVLHPTNSWTPALCQSTTDRCRGWRTHCSDIAFTDRDRNLFPPYSNHLSTGPG